MRNRILIWILAVALIIGALPLFAQKIEQGPQPEATLLLEQFTGTTFPPTGWNVYNIDGGGTTWVRTTARYYSTPACAYHNYSTAGMQDGWLVTPPIALGMGTNTLTFWEYTAFPTYYYKHSALICTSNCLPPTAPFSNWTEIAVFSGPTAAWRQQTVDLTAYQGQTVYIAFRYQGNDADAWYIDDVRVTFPGPTLTFNSAPIVSDVCGALGGPGENNGISDPGETVSLNIVLNNTGDQTATGISAVLSTTTPGVVVTQPNSTYPDIPPSGTGTNNTAFAYTVDQMATCGTTINFNLHVTANGGWGWDIPFTKTIGSSIYVLNENFYSV
ncbi:MAG: choice-of-anchor J domain-containing protein, partial [Acidobacteria bacterium]|nr:choice-of-anchor J domain-containing protein [Acidobacteriota bacterium]